MRIVFNNCLKLAMLIIDNPDKKYGYFNQTGSFFIVQYNSRTNSIITEHPLTGAVLTAELVV